MPRLYMQTPLPPPLPVAETANAALVTQPVNDSSAQSPTSSIVIVVIVVASAVIVSGSLYLLLKFVSRRFHHSFRTFSAAEDVVQPTQQNLYVNDQPVATNSFLDSLPLFSFSSVTGNITGGDCSVCLSKFERHDQMRLLPLCCHAFHASCIDTWLSANQTCPLCRSTVQPTESEELVKILAQSNSSTAEDRSSNGNRSFRIEIGSISRRRAAPDLVDGRRAYSIGSFDYIVDDGYEVSVDSTHRRGISECTSVDKESVGAPTAPEAPGESVTSYVGAGRGWLREYVDRLASFSASSRTMSFRSSGRFFAGSSGRSNSVIAADDVEPHRIGEEISEMFRWLSGV